MICTEAETLHHKGNPQKQGLARAPPAPPPLGRCEVRGQTETCRPAVITSLFWL